MNVVEVFQEVVFVADGVFPKPPLPHAAFTVLLLRFTAQRQLFDAEKRRWIEEEVGSLRPAEHGLAEAFALRTERVLAAAGAKRCERLIVRLSPSDARLRFNCAIAYARSDEASEAVAMAKDALALARSHGDVALGDEIEAWLTSFRAAPADDRRVRGRASQ